MSTTEQLPCPHCGTLTTRYKNPVPTVDIIIEIDDRIVMIERKNPPYGWALPGGFVDYGETLEEAARREAFEETGLRLENLTLFGCYSDPKRDPRQHTITTVFIATATGAPAAADDAIEVALYTPSALPASICFDHRQILSDYQHRNTTAYP